MLENQRICVSAIREGGWLYYVDSVCMTLEGACSSGEVFFYARIPEMSSSQLPQATTEACIFDM